MGCVCICMFTGQIRKLDTYQREEGEIILYVVLMSGLYILLSFVDDNI